VVIAVAFDTQGRVATEKWIRPTEASRPQFIIDLMGWSDSDRKPPAAPAYPCLIDENHIVAELYNMVNVPMAVWIDEEGRMVRAPEPAGAGDTFRTMDRTTFRMPKEAVADAKHQRRVYVDALRDWVENGASSVHALSPEEARRQMRVPGEQEARAAANFRLGLELHRLGRSEAALRYLAEARRLRPESWSYRRQSWELEEAGKAAGPEFWAAVDALGDERYYPAIEMAGMKRPNSSQ
jgi:hypothetical protein